MLGFLRKDGRDIDQVIFDCATHQRPRDHERLLKLLRGREIFATIESSSVPLEHGRKLFIGPEDTVLLRTGSLPNGLTCAIFYVDRGDPRLGPRYAGITASEAFEMVTKSGLDTLLIQNSKDSWVAFPRGDLLAIRARYLG
jgi:hypothetical protein